MNARLSPAGLRHRAQRGTTMIEVLVSMVISVIGLLGIAGFQLRSYSSETESFQRAKAAVLLNDIVNRINANRTAADEYVADDIGLGADQDCSAAGAQSAVDLCEFGNLLRGAAETSGATRLGSMMSARACITAIAPRTYVVAVVWEGVTPTAAPATTCGQNAYTTEEVRRALTSVVFIGDLG